MKYMICTFIITFSEKKMPESAPPESHPTNGVVNPTFTDEDKSRTAVNEVTSTVVAVYYDGNPDSAKEVPTTKIPSINKTLTPPADKNTKPQQPPSRLNKVSFYGSLASQTTTSPFE